MASGVGIAAAIVLACALCASNVQAQTDEDKAAARAAATDGAAALEDGRFEEALDRFTRAEALIHAPPHLLYIARAQTKLGRLVSARETYIKIGREQLAADAPRAFVDAQQSAATELAALTPRIAELLVQVDANGADPAGVTVLVDGVPMAPSLVGLNRPFDPGLHKFEARANGFTSDPVSVQIADGARERVVLKLRPVASETSASTPQPALAPGPEPASSSNTTRTLGFVGLGVGAVGFAMSGIFVARNNSKRSDADALCPGLCPEAKRQEIESLDSEADSAATLAWVGLGVGVVGAAVGVALLVASAKGGSDPARSARLRPRFVPLVGPTSLGVRGTF